MSGATLVERGIRPCETCGRVHNCWREPWDHTYGSWADQKDGHYYKPEPWETIARRLMLKPP